MTSSATEKPTEAAGVDRVPVYRAAVGGLLMGLANLVPGVSGGTMIVVVGLYDRFIESIADVTRLRFTRQNVLFLAIMGITAAVAIGAFAGTLGRAVSLHRSAMFSLFIGMTLGGAPLLLGMIKKFRFQTSMGVLLGLAVMVAIALTRDEPPNRQVVREAIEQGTIVIQSAYARDAAAGILGMSAMVLPGISGAYMLLILGRYETILGAISIVKNVLTGSGGQSDLSVALHVLVPTAIGAILSLVLLSNILKWLLHHYRDATLGVLLGILLGSVVGIWPFDSVSEAGDYVIGSLLAVGGFAATTLLSRIGRGR
ncbi:MAG: DUF368 domain-containing protein [Planctomycetes bacterium]|nr:DUF368 domain-containing protein [Planctomycetota bacterium]